MKHRPLGRTGLYVSEICLGTMTFGGQGWWKAMGEVDQSSANALIERALAAGVNFIDTADVYSEGHSERILGQALRDLKVPRESVIIATKVRGRTAPGPNTVGLSRNHIMNSVEASLKRLGLDYIDLYQVHGADLVTPIEETMRALDNLVSRGLVRYIGASNMSAWQIMKANGLARQYNYRAVRNRAVLLHHRRPRSGARNHSDAERPAARPDGLESVGRRPVVRKVRAPDRDAE